jgi:hypothetical protein
MGFEPIECEISPPFPYAEELRRAGHEVRAVDEVGRTVHVAEFFHETGRIRAGGSSFAAGI